MAAVLPHKMGSSNNEIHYECATVNLCALKCFFKVNTESTSQMCSGKALQTMCAVRQKARFASLMHVIGTVSQGALEHEPGEEQPHMVFLSSSYISSFLVTRVTVDIIK